MSIREANINDWDKLFSFYSRIYRRQHPLLNKEFWIWQFGDKKFGRAFIFLNDKNEISGHVGANFAGDIAWIINVYLDEEYRRKGILRELYDLARCYFPLGATAANKAGLGLYKNMRWYRYYDLVRYVKVNPNIKNPNFYNVCRKIEVSVEDLLIKDSHYFRQPSLKGLKFSDGSRVISQENVGGLRIVDINHLEFLENQAWELGYLWMDYITSWNDLKTKEIEKRNWKLDFETIVPWRLNPIQMGCFCEISFLSEKPLSNEFVVHRSFSDHGRVGSIIES